MIEVDNRRLTIERRFNAPRSRVWQAYTDAELLDRWWAPKPWKAETVTMDFRVGGHWHYAMRGPEGEQHFGRMDFLEIEPESRYLAGDVFCDASGAANPDLPKQTFTTSFVDEGETTRVIVVVDYRVWAQMAWALHGGAIVLLVGVLFFGHEVAGNRSWLVIGPGRWQRLRGS